MRASGSTILASLRMPRDRETGSVDGRGYIPVELAARYVPLRLSISMNAIGVYNVQDVELLYGLGTISKSDDWRVPEALADALIERNILIQDLQREMDLTQQERISWRNKHPMPIIIMTGGVREVWLQGRQDLPLPPKGLVYSEPWQYCTRALVRAIQSSGMNM